MAIVTNSYLLIPLLLGFFGLALIPIVIRGHIKSTVHRLFALYLFTIALWGIFIFAMRYSPDIDRAYYWDRFPFSLAAFMSVILYHFSVRYTRTRRKHNYIPFLYIACFIFAILIFNGYILKGMQIKPYGYAPDYDIVFIPYALFTYVLSILSLVNFIKVWRHSHDIDQKNRTVYIFIGIIIMILGGFGDLLPSFGLPLYPCFIIGMLIFCILVTTAIVKHNLLDIRVAIRKSTAYIITSMLLATPFIGIFLIVTNASVHNIMPVWGYLAILLLLAFIWPYFWKIVQQWVDRWFFRGRYDALKALDAFSRDTQSLSNPYRLASTMVKLITSALNTKSAYLLLLTHTRDAYSTVSFSGLNNVYSGISVKSTSLLVKWLDRYGSILLIQDMEMAPQLQGITAHEKQALDDINAHIIIPLKVPDQPLFGMLILGPKRSDEAYTIEDKQLLTTISNQMTMKLYNLQLYTNILHSRENIQAWINTMPDCIIVVSSDSTIEFMNLAATKQFGDRIGEIYSQVINDEVKYIYYSLARTDKQNKVIRRNYLNISGRQYDIEQASLQKIDGTTSEVRILRDITDFKQAEEELRLRALLLDNSTDSIFLYDTDGNFHYVNEAASRTFGYSKEELLKINYENLLVSEKKDSTILFRKKTADSDYIVIETGLLHKNGSVIPVEIYSRAIISNNKKYFLAAVRDISRRKRNEQELRQSQEKLMRIFQSVGDGISVTDLKGIFTEVNEKTLQLHGYSDASEMIGKNGIEYIAPEDRERVNQYYRQVPIRGANNMEITMLRKDGSTFMAEVNTSIIRNSTNEPTGVISIVRDITERKKAEEELKMRALLLDNATDAIALYDLDKNLHYINKTGEKIYGYSKDELLQMKLEDIFASKGKQIKIADVKKLLKTGYLAFEMNIKSKKGAIIPAEFHISLVEINERKYALAVVRDISSRKKAEEERRQLEQKAQRTSQLASVGEMAAGIAHEINNPLTSVIGYAQLLMKKDIPEDIKEDISIIHEGAQRVSGIVNRMLTFARQRKPKREYSDINSIIETTLELREYSLRNNNIKVVRQFAPDLPMTVADNGQLQQVFLNIIVNAETEMKLAHGKGTLIIKTRTKGRKIQISFTDDGPGIAKELLARLFDPFFTTREVGQGTGLGLSVCHGIISEHGGQIYVESVQGKGATFTVELPVIESVDRLDQDNTDISTDYGVKKAKILVVDDEATIRQYLSQLLIREGYKVESVEDAATALEIIRYKRFSLLLLDVKMPSMNGMELYIQLQDIAKSLAKRVLFMTGDTMGEDTYRFFRETGAHYITKPFNETELKEKIRSMLD